MGNLVRIDGGALDDDGPGDPWRAAGAAMREARELRGLSPHEAARRLNLAMGSTVISPALIELWESGREPVPDIAIFIRAVRMAGGDAAREIFSSLA